MFGVCFTRFKNEELSAKVVTNTRDICVRTSDDELRKEERFCTVVVVVVVSNSSTASAKKTSSAVGGIARVFFSFPGGS